MTSTDCRVETQLTATVNAGDASLPVQSTAGFSAADGIWIERTGANEEQTTVAGVLSNSLTASVSMGHPGGSFVTRMALSPALAHLSGLPLGAADHDFPGPEEAETVALPCNHSFWMSMPM